MTTRIHAIPTDLAALGNRPDMLASHTVMVAHAGRSQRTGSKVHLATMITWASGKKTVGAAHCSANGHLRGQLVTDRDFTAVSCKKCGASVEAAERRNAKAITMEVL
jgi:hypothetical protein